MNSPRTPQNLSDDSPLAKRIVGAAHKIAWGYGIEPEDVQSEITLAILERYAEEPEFLEQTDAYIVNHGAWRARNELNRQFRSYYNRTVDGDAPATEDGDAPATEDGDALLDLLPASGSWEDVELSFEVRDALSSLAERDQQICAMFGGGWTASEIADETDCSRRTIYYRINNPIREAFSEYYSAAEGGLHKPAATLVLLP